MDDLLCTLYFTKIIQCGDEKSNGLENIYSRNMTIKFSYFHKAEMMLILKEFDGLDSWVNGLQTMFFFILTLMVMYT